MKWYEILYYAAGVTGWLVILWITLVVFLSF